MQITSPGVTRFDVVRDTQRTFRLLLDSLAHSGQLYQLPRVGLTFGSAHVGSTAFEQFQALGAILLTLLDHEVTFCLLGPDELTHELSAQLTGLTSSHSVDREQADYVVALQPVRAALPAQLKPGNLLYPDASATLICLVPELASRPLADRPGTLLGLKGPGVVQGQSLWVAETDATFFHALSTLNAQYPLGIDTLWITPRGRMAGLPRSTQLSILVG